MCRFTATRRIKHKRDFERVFADGRRYHQRHFLLVVVAGSGGEARLGIAVSKRVSKLAVRRNRIKRIIREAFRLKYSDLSNVDCVVVAKARAGRVDDGQLWADLSILFDQFIKTWVDC